MSAIQTHINAGDLGDNAPLDLKTIHHRGFKWATLGLMLIASVATIIAVTMVFGAGPVGLWAAVLCAPVVGLRVGAVYRWATHSRRLRHTLEPGLVPCPACSSLQTDLVERKVTDEVTQHRVCFQCDHQWER